MRFFRPRARVTILMRTQNRALYLPRALASVLAQTFTEWQLALVNDGGDMASLIRAIEPWRPKFGKRLLVLNHSKTATSSIGAPLNFAIRATRGEFLAVHDDDDSWEPEFLAECVAKLEDPAFGACVTKTNLIREVVEGGSLREESREVYNAWQGDSISLFRLAEENTLAPIALVFRRNVLKEIGYRRDEFGPLEDWDFNLRLFARYRVAVSPRLLANYHLRRSGTGTDANFFTSSADCYGKLDIELKNDLLRRDLQTGEAGLGFLVGMSAGHGQLFQKIHQVQESVDRLR